MELVWSDAFAKRTERVQGSQIRNFFRLTERPEVISFAGGFPDSDYFPRQDISRTIAELIEEEGRHALQYTPTEGSYELRIFMARKMRKEGVMCEGEDVVVTSGTQQALDLISRTLINPGEAVLVEEPAYIGGMGAIKSSGGLPVGVPLDENGVCPKKMEKVLLKLASEGKSPKIFYTVPNFNNPTGYTTSETRRRKVLELASRFNFIIIEDNPYGELCYDDCIPPSYKSMDIESRVVYVGSYSKIFIPGIRVGWIVAAPEMVEKLVLLKQAADLCSGSLGQRLVYRMALDGYVDENLSRMLGLYRKKRDTMLYAMKQFFPPEIKYTRPGGGFFIWVTFPDHFPAADQILVKAVERKVAFVHGQGFYSNGGGSHTARFSFSQPSVEDIHTGISRLGELFDELNNAQPVKIAAIK